MGGKESGVVIEVWTSGDEAWLGRGHSYELRVGIEVCHLVVCPLAFVPAAAYWSVFLGVKDRRVVH
jgi:hypothetical protein